MDTVLNIFLVGANQKQKVNLKSGIYKGRYLLIKRFAIDCQSRIFPFVRNYSQLGTVCNAWSIGQNLFLRHSRRLRNCLNSTERPVTSLTPHFSFILDWFALPACPPTLLFQSSETMCYRSRIFRIRRILGYFHFFFYVIRYCRLLTKQFFHWHQLIGELSEALHLYFDTCTNFAIYAKK